MQNYVLLMYEFVIASKEKYTQRHKNEYTRREDMVRCVPKTWLSLSHINMTIANGSYGV